MQLNPDKYECPDHQADITGQVRDALEDHGPPVAYHRDRHAPRPFQVIVTCPGTGNAGQHPLTCTGTWAP